MVREKSVGRRVSFKQVSELILKVFRVFHAREGVKIRRDMGGGGERDIVS